jgi:hypothetical protein
VTLRATSIARLSRILELILDLPRDLVGKQHRTVVVHLPGLDDDADLPAGLQCVDLVHARLLRRELLEGGEPLDVVLEALAPRAGT